MKVKKTYTFLFLLGAIAFTGCKKDDGAMRESIKTTDVPTITTNVDPTGSTAITVSNQAAFAGKFTVSLYFPGATPPTKVDIVVRKNSLNTCTSTLATNANVKLFKANITSLPATFTVTAAEIASLFGSPIALKDVYDFAPDIYVGDTKFEAFPTTGIGTGSWRTAAHGFSEFARFCTQ